MSSKPRGNNEPDWGFDWPPKQRIVPSEIVELEKSSAESTTPAASQQQQMLENPLLEFNTRSPIPLPLPVRLPQPQPAAGVPATQPSSNGSSAHALVREELPEEVQEELRGLDADFWGPIALEGYLKRGWMMPATIVMLALVAVVEGIFLLRGGSQSSDDVARPFTAPPTRSRASLSRKHLVPPARLPGRRVHSRRAHLRRVRRFRRARRIANLRRHNPLRQI